MLADNDGWSQTDFLLADLVQVNTGERHPNDPRVRRAAAARRERLAQGAVRAAARRAALGISGSVFRRNKKG